MTPGETGNRPARLGERPYRSAYRPEDFPSFGVTVDVAVFTIQHGVLCSLLVRPGRHTYRGEWSLPGGFVTVEESVEEAAVRELAEWTGMREAHGAHLEQLRTYSEHDRDPRMRVISVAYFALAPNSPDPRARGDAAGSGDDAAGARWWPIDDLNLDDPNLQDPNRDDPADPDAAVMAFDHRRTLLDALDRVRSKLEYTTLATRFVTEPFTLGDLRRVYQAVWGAAPDLGNFRRKVLGTDGFVLPRHRSSRSAGVAGGRPPLLYTAGPTRLLHPPFLRTPHQR